MSKTLYERLGGYDAIAAVASDLLPRLQSDPQLARFWKERGMRFLGCSNEVGMLFERAKSLLAELSA